MQGTLLLILYGQGKPEHCVEDSIAIAVVNLTYGLYSRTPGSDIVRTVRNRMYRNEQLHSRMRILRWQCSYVCKARVAPQTTRCRGVWTHQSNCKEHRTK